MNNETKALLVEKAIEIGTFPEKLYKYRTVEQAKLVLENFSFWFALPESFNDPFDCNLSENQTPTKEDLLTHLKRIKVDSTLIARTEKAKNNNPNLICKLVQDAKEQSIRKKGVLSLSRDYDNILMWSHYSEYHQGVVFGLELRKDLAFFVTPMNIEYEETYDELNYLKNPGKATIDTLKIKSSQWSYEAEVRIYKNNKGLCKINTSAISDIYFGLETPEPEIAGIMKTSKDKGLTHIKFHKAEKVHGEFKLIFNQL